MKLNKFFAGCAIASVLASSAFAQGPDRGGLVQNYPYPDPSNAGVVSGAGSWSISSTGYLSGVTTDARGFSIAGASIVTTALSGTYVATIIQEQTNDVTGQTGWFAVTCSDITSIGSSSGIAYVCPVVGVRHRLRVSAYTSGTINARVVVGKITPTSTGVFGTTASGIADDNSNPVKIGCVAAIGGFPVITSGGARTSVSCSTKGAIAIAAVGATSGYIELQVAGAAVASATSTGLSVEEGGRPFAHITTLATTTPKSGAGYLHTVCVNTKGATANTATIYDNTAGSGTVIAVLDTTAAIGCQTYDIRFATGLTIVTATGTAADITVSYR